ncbi:hypothetical protein ACLI4Z_11275 [Natrialbaceae archaeon A-arb3/5]
MDAVDNLSDAIDVTRELLLPVRFWLWVKLAIVVLFVGGGMMTGGVPSGDVTMFADEPAVEDGTEDVPEDFWVIFAAIVAGIVLLWLIFALISAIMEFVFVESLRSSEVHIRQYFRENLGRGFRLFGFRILVGLIAAAIVFGPLAFVILSASSPEAILGSVLLILLFGLFVYLFYAIVMRFTSEFVAPIMLLESRGVLSSWSRFWSTFKANWSEYVVYLLLVWILQLVINLAAGILLLLAVLLVAIPFGIVAFLLLMVGDIGVWLAIPVIFLGVIAMILVVALIQMPIRTYFQYYGLLLLGDTNDELDLIAEQRAAVRSDGGAHGVDSTGPESDETRNGWDDTTDEESTSDRWDEDDGWDTSDEWDQSDEDDGWDTSNEDDRDDDRGW